MSAGCAERGGLCHSAPRAATRGARDRGAEQEENGGAHGIHSWRFMSQTCIARQTTTGTGSSQCACSSGCLESDSAVMQKR